MGCSSGIRNAIGALLQAGACAALVSAGVGCGATPASSNNSPMGTAGAPSVGLPGASPVGPTLPGSSNGVTAMPGSTAPVAGAVPCDVDTVVKSRCQTCHGATPIGGAPMSLVTLADFKSDHVVRTTKPLMGQTVKVYELARIRINGEMNTPKMPQGASLVPADFMVLNAWLAAGAQAGAACPSGSTGGGGTTGGAGTAMGTGGMGGSGIVNPVGGSPIIADTTPDQCAGDPNLFKPLVAVPGETCYEFQTHGVTGVADTSKFMIPTGESYNQFYFAIPWQPGTVATRFGAKFDNLAVLHHWLGFSTTSGQPAGTVSPNVTGTTLGEGTELVGGWAVGGCNVNFPPDMGLKLPDSGGIMIQWHHFNSTGAPAMDGSSVQWCTVPAAMRPNIGGLTFLGTEDLNGPTGMPAGQESKFSGTCTNNSGKPITIVGFDPHMHLLGTHMTSTVQRAGGGPMEMPFDHSFLFDHQVNYMLSKGYVLQPGDSITSTCTFNNTTTANVAFGQSTKQEMCYQFTFAYPYGALNNGVISLIGAGNTCW
jgi:hypothetical protein